MEGVDFEENNLSKSFTPREGFVNQMRPPLVRFLVDKGFVKDDRTAGNLLIMITLFFFLVSLFILFKYVFYKDDISAGLEKNPQAERFDRIR